MRYSKFGSEAHLQEDPVAQCGRELNVVAKWLRMPEDGRRAHHHARKCAVAISRCLNARTKILDELYGGSSYSDSDSSSDGSDGPDDPDDAESSASTSSSSADPDPQFNSDTPPEPVSDPDDDNGDSRGDPDSSSESGPPSTCWATDGETPETPDATRPTRETQGLAGIWQTQRRETEAAAICLADAVGVPPGLTSVGHRAVQECADCGSTESPFYSQDMD